MTTRVLRVRADISGALTALDRLQQRGRRLSRQLNQVSGGSLGAGGGAIAGAGRAGGGLGRIALAGAGIGAGAAIFERLFEQLFELFEDTPLLEDFTGAMQTLLRATAPLAGVLIQSLTPVIVALTPAILPVVKALTPLIELLGAQLLTAVTLLTPAITLLARGLEFVTVRVRDGVLAVIRQVIDVINRLPGVDVRLPDFRTDTIGGVQQQLQDAAHRRRLDDPESSAGSPRTGGAGDLSPSSSSSPVPDHLVHVARGLEERSRYRFGPQPGAGRQPRQDLVAHVTVSVGSQELETAVRRVAVSRREYGA